MRTKENTHWTLPNAKGHRVHPEVDTGEVRGGKGVALPGAPSPSLLPSPQTVRLPGSKWRPGCEEGRPEGAAASTLVTALRIFLRAAIIRAFAQAGGQRLGLPRAVGSLWPPRARGWLPEPLRQGDRGKRARACVHVWACARAGVLWVLIACVSARIPGGMGFA